MDPIPPINKVFALISQEENQKRLNTQSNGNDAYGAVAFALKSDNVRAVSNHRIGAHGNLKKKERPYCTHCKFHGHSMDKCYKIHGYPPGYKPRPKDNFQGYSTSNPVNQISLNTQMNQHSGMESFMQNLNPEQYQQLMSVLSNNLTSSSIVTATDHDKHTTSCAASGTCHSMSMTPIFTDKSIWIVDSGATKHVCSIADAFFILRPINDASIILPNHTRILVMSG
ncbi:uncharacterized protein LOC111386890 isoform X1 [Olea europaea var. sylvestris]|uniref:uncharacterized protein LOC111386890 isoform X1 n=1 Tax=Olea europaea var. sylvestris TaxID=158386 RepID=UPI000C1D7566|nr:uncharacterized protein LOC111386890 isoform X1 [Olea europaea var. sylvestris]